MVSLPSLAALPVIGDALRNQLVAPIARSLAQDRLPFEQYTDPPGDPGLFGPGSATWRVHADPSMLVGGLAALLLQTAHPLAMAGVADHSNYRSDPLGRLSRTGSFVTGTTYGSTEVADRLLKLVRGIHRTVRGTAPDGRSYSAGDPELITWVHATEVSSFLRAHQRFVPFPVRGDQADRYIHEMAVIPERLGAEPDRIPRSRAALRAYFRDVRPDLAVGDQARDAVRFLTRPLDTHPLVGGAHQVVIQAAIGLLPGWARDMLGLRQPTLVEMAVVRPATLALLGTMRLAGGTPPPLVQARRRCAAEPPPRRVA
ncbi:MAG TPA: oxygenase MpaB family protein [Acidimicrobiales bacterium]|nr:oxygenase MpaB family protein [Acidimicrobiales bacterium]